MTLRPKIEARIDNERKDRKNKKEQNYMRQTKNGMKILGSKKKKLLAK